MAPALTEADLIFPEQAMNFSTTLHYLKRSALSITNRLNSITSDAHFVQSVSAAYGLPLVANERCGTWYIPLEKKVESVYFKSTDGHMNEWGFNLRRLNLQVFGVVEKFGGCVIVDSTRRGKSMPDALSKTVPIWCCVMNRAVFGAHHDLYTPPKAVSASEHAQIDRRIDGFVHNFLDICKPDLDSLRRQLRKPLRPLWVIQGSTLPVMIPEFSDHHAIVLCTASRQVRGAEGSEGGYIQGAADDHEAWSQGLTPKLFWTNKDSLLSTNEEELPALIRNLITSDKGSKAEAVLIKPTPNLYVSSSEQLDIDPFEVVISCTSNPLITTDPEHRRTKQYLHLPLAAGKLGSRDLRLQLPKLRAFMQSLPLETHNIVVCCPTGKDISVGVALAILCLYTTESGQISGSSINSNVDKKFIKHRLTWITTSSPALNPSRATLNAVNAFLMPDPSTRNKPEHVDHTPSKLLLVNEDGTSVPTSDPRPAIETSEPPQTPQETLFHTLPTTAWTFTRTLTSRLPTHPSGTVHGTATFEPLFNLQNTLLYSEEGQFTTSTGLQFTARRRYIYTLATTEAGSRISVRFHEEDKENGIGGLFVEMGDLGRVEGEGEVFEARNRERHLCGEDLYGASWRVGGGLLGMGLGREDGGDGGSEAWWEVEYEVKGPKKDYVSKTTYTRM